MTLPSIKGNMASLRARARSVYSALRNQPTLATPLAVADLFLRGNTFLQELGWLETYRSKLPINHAGPLPWLTYPAIAFLEKRVRDDLRVFEYGSGYSSLWWASRVRHVVACEHDVNWLDALRSRVPENVTLVHRPLEIDSDYCREAARHRADVIVIDGRDRINCAKQCLPGLSDDGVIIWDNSDRERYEPGFAFLAESGFRRLDFTGVGPVNITLWCTSIFYRRDNCLGI